MTADFIAAARDAFAFRARRDPEHAAHWHGLVIDATRRLDALTAVPTAPVLVVRDGEVRIGGRRMYTRLGGGALAAQVLADGQADFVGLYPTPGAAREALRRFSRWLERQGEFTLAEQIWSIRCLADGVAHR